MTFNVVTITFLVGLALMVAAIFGGGLEVKEVKIPSMGPASRALSFGVGAFLTWLCVSNPDLLNSAPAANVKVMPQLKLETAAPTTRDPGTTPAPRPDEKSILAKKGDNTVEATVIFKNSLGFDHISEDVDIILDGQAYTLSVDQAKKFRIFPYKTDRKQIFYVLSGTVIRKTSNGEKTYMIEGDGILEVADGRVLELTASSSEDQARVVRAELKQVN